MIIYEEPRELLRAEEQTLLTPINIDAVGGGGLPTAFRYAYPGLFKAYHQASERRVFDSEGIFVYDVNPTRKIVCLPIKQHGRHTQQEKLDCLEESLLVVATSYRQYGITSLAMGDLEMPWEEVKTIVHRCLDWIDLPIGICREAVAV